MVKYVASMGTAWPGSTVLEPCQESGSGDEFRKNPALPQENQMAPVCHVPRFLHFVWTASGWISRSLLQYKDNKMTLRPQNRAGSPWGAFDPSVFWNGGTDTSYTQNIHREIRGKRVFVVPFSEVVVVRKERLALFELWSAQGCLFDHTLWLGCQLDWEFVLWPHPSWDHKCLCGKSVTAGYVLGSVWSVNTSLLYLVAFNFWNHRKVLTHIPLLLCGSLPAVPTLPCQSRGIVCSHSSELLTPSRNSQAFQLLQSCWGAKLCPFPPSPLSEPLLTHPAAPEPGLGPRDQTLGVASLCHIYPGLPAAQTDPDFWRLN